MKTKKWQLISVQEDEKRSRVLTCRKTVEVTNLIFFFLIYSLKQYKMRNNVSKEFRFSFSRVKKLVSRQLYRLSCHNTCQTVKDLTDFKIFLLVRVYSLKLFFVSCNERTCTIKAVLCPAAMKIFTLR